MAVQNTVPNSLIAVNDQDFEQLSVNIRLNNVSNVQVHLAYQPISPIFHIYFLLIV